MLSQYLFGFFETHHHERGGVGVCRGTVFCQDCGRQQTVLNGVASLGVDGMGILLAVLIVEVAIVAAGCHGYIRDIEHRLQFLVGVQRVFGRFVHADAPRLLFLVDTLGDYLASYLYHIVVDAFLAQQSCHYVTTVSLGYGRAVEHDARILFQYVIVGGELHLLVAYCLSQVVDDLFVGFHTFLETESPFVDQWGNGNVEGSVGLVGDVLCQEENLCKHRVDYRVLVAVHLRDNGGLVEWRERLVHLLQLNLYLFLQIGVAMISDVVDGSEDETLVVLIVDVFLSLLQDDDRADDEEQQEGNLPDELFLVHIDGIGGDG